MASTFVPARLHPPPKKRLITRKTTIRPYVFTKYNREAKEEEFQENKKLLSNKDEQCKSSLRTNSVSDTERQNNAHTTSIDTVKSSDLNSTSNKSFTRKRNVSRCNLSLRSDKDKDNVENLLTVKTRSATSKLSQSFLTEKQEQCRSPLKTSNVSDNEFQNNTSKRNKSSNKSFNNKKNTSKSNFNTMSEKIEDNVENSIKTRSTTAKLSQSLTINPTYFKPNETASVLQFKSPKNLSRISCHKEGERSFQNSEPDQNSSVQLSQSSVSGSYSTDAILICRPANEKSSEITENNPVVNVVPSDSNSSHLYKNPSFYKKAGSSTKLKSSSSVNVPASKSILKAPVKNDDRMNQSIPPEMYLDTPTPTSKRKHSNPINLSYQFKKLKNTPNKSILRKVQKENSKMVSQPSHKCLTDQFLSSDNFKDAQQRDLASDSLETTYAGNISNSVNEKSLNLSTWKDGDVQPVLESTRYSLIPQNKQTNKSYINLPETPIIQRKYDDEKTGNFSKSVRWNSTIRYQIVSPTPDKRRHRNLGRRKLVSKQKITSSLKKQKETQTKQKPSTSKSSNNQEISQKSPSPLHHQQPKASLSTSMGTKKMILRKSNRKKKMPELDADVFLDTILQKTSSFRETAEKEDEAAADVFCEVSTKIILKKIEEHFNVGTSKKSGKNDKSKAQKLQITVLKKHEDFKRLNEKIVDDKREVIQLKENKDRKEEINLFLFRLQDFHQRLIN